MSSTATAAANVHLLIFPCPAQGHLLALLDLTHYLALKGFKITILVTPKNLPALNKLLSDHPNSIQTLVLPFAANPKLPLGVEHVKDIGNSGNVLIISSLSKLEGEIIQWFKSHPSPPQAMLSDFFLGWTQDMAEKLNIPRIGFYSTRAIVDCVLCHLLQNRDSLLTSNIVEFLDMPRSPSFAQEHLPSIFKKYKKGDPDWEIVRESLLANSKSWGIVINSFYALEGEHLDHLKKRLGHDRVYSVGPLCLVGGAGNSKPAISDSETRSQVLNWLDKCQEDSVLYVCFGSQKPLTRAQAEVLALGLEQSKTRFVWVVKFAVIQQDEAHERFLDEFEERVAERGLVVRGYAPQVEILNHKAVGVFLTHCGWNSLLEGLGGGVMFLAWPMEADQYLNARVLVEDLQIAVRLCEGENTVPDSHQLAQTICESIGGNLPQRNRAKVMRQKAFEAVETGGTSSTDLDKLVKAINQIQVPK